MRVSEKHTADVSDVWTMTLLRVGHLSMSECSGALRQEVGPTVRPAEGDGLPELRALLGSGSRHL